MFFLFEENSYDLFSLAIACVTSVFIGMKSVLVFFSRAQNAETVDSQATLATSSGYCCHFGLCFKARTCFPRHQCCAKYWTCGNADCNNCVQCCLQCCSVACTCARARDPTCLMHDWSVWHQWQLRGWLKNRLHYTQYSKRNVIIIFLFLGECADFDKHCGKTTGFPKSMCSSHPDLMERICPKLCNLCSKWTAFAILSFKTSVHQITQPKPKWT